MFIALDPFELPESVAPSGTGATAYPNGYAFRRAFRIGGGVLTGTGALDDLPLRFDETLASFRTVANGGNVSSASGWDILFTDRLGTKIPHELETYDGAAGRVAAWVLPPTPTPGVDLDLYVYYGKAGVAAPEANPQATWVGALVSIRMPDGQDMSPGARHMASSGVGTGTILGMPAATMTAASYFESTSPGWWAGLSAGTTAIWVQISSLPASADVGGNIMRVGGAAAGSGQHGLWVDISATDVTPNLTNYIGSTVRIGGTLLWDYSASNVAVTGHPFLLAVPFATGAFQGMVIDGAAATVVHNAVTPPTSGTTGTASGDVFRIGAANGPPNTSSVVGAVGRMLAWPDKKSTDFLAFLDLNARYPHAVYGIGDEDAASDTDRSPIMAPTSGSVSAGGTASFDILARASEPDGQTMVAGLTTPAPSLGSASVAANAMIYVAGATQGLDPVGVTATAGAKSARALCMVTVGTGTVSNSAIPLPLAPQSQRIVNWETAKLSTGSATLVEGASETVGLELKAGPKDDANQPIAEVSLGMYAAPYTISLDYQPVSTWTAEEPTTSAGVFAQLDIIRLPSSAADPNVSKLGTSTGSPAVWTANYAPADAYYNSKNVTGIRFSFDTHALAPGANSNQIRVRALAGGSTLTQLGGVNAFDFRGHGAGWTTLTFSVTTGNDVSWTAAWPDGTSTSESVNHSDIGTNLGSAPHNVILLAYSGRDARFRNVVITPGAAPAPAPGGGTGAGGDEGWAPAIPAIDPNKVTNCSPAQLQSTYNNLPSNPGGWTICVNFFGFGNNTGNTVSGALNLNKNGTAAAPIVIRAGRWDASSHTFSEPQGNANSTFFPDSNHPQGTASWTGLCTASGNNNLIRGLRFNGGARTTGDGNRFNRCFFDGLVSGGGNLVVDTGLNNMWDWCEWGNGFHLVGLQHLPRSGSKGSRVYRCWFHDQGDGGLAEHTLHMIGASNNDADQDIDHLVLETLYSNAGTAKGGWEVKSKNARCERCASRAGGGDPPRIYFRHGMNGLICALYSEGDTGYMTGRGYGHRFADSVHTGTVRGWGPAAGNMSWVAWKARADSGADMSGRYPAGDSFILTRITDPVVGDDSAGDGSVKPVGSILEACGTPTFKNGVTAANITTRAATSYGRELPNKAARQWDPSEVGPNAAYVASA